MADDGCPQEPDEEFPLFRDYWQALETMTDEEIAQALRQYEKDPRDETDWEYLRSMTPEQIHQAALDDPDNPPLTPEQLAKFRPAAEWEPLRTHLREARGRGCQADELRKIVREFGGVEGARNHGHLPNR